MLHSRLTTHDSRLTGTGMARCPRAGFTLLELSIVVTIIGLIVGGVLAGRELIRASELRSIIDQHREFMTATRAFKEKYFYLPGDLPNGTQFWGAAAASASCGGTVTVDSRTCDGNGDAKINSHTNSNEPYHFWKQLANARLIRGAYIGSAPSAMPASKIKSGYWGTKDFGTKVATAYVFDGVYNNIVSLYSPTTVFGFPPVLTAPDAWYIDSKIDDGKPATGALVAGTKTNLTACTNVNPADAVAVRTATLTADYLFQSSTIGCSLIFRNQF